MYSVSEIKKGLKVEIDGKPYTVTYFQFVKPGKGQAFTRTKLKNLLTGAVLDRTFKIVESLKPANITSATMQYMYNDAEGYHFMDTSSYEQITISKETLGDDIIGFLVDEMQVDVLFWESKPINIDLPNFVELEITYCEPGARGNTATGTLKPATVSTGAQIQVPLFIENGEWIRIDTRTGEYVERVKK